MGSEAFQHCRQESFCNVHGSEVTRAASSPPSRFSPYSRTTDSCSVRETPVEPRGRGPLPLLCPRARGIILPNSAPVRWIEASRGQGECVSTQLRTRSRRVSRTRLVASDSAFVRAPSCLETRSRELLLRMAWSRACVCAVRSGMLTRRGIPGVAQCPGKKGSPDQSHTLMMTGAEMSTVQGPNPGERSVFPPDPSPTTHPRGGVSTGDSQGVLGRSTRHVRVSSLRLSQIMKPQCVTPSTAEDEPTRGLSVASGIGGGLE